LDFNSIKNIDNLIDYSAFFNQKNRKSGFDEIPFFRQARAVPYYSQTNKALKQIKSKNYDERFLNDPRPRVYTAHGHKFNFFYKF